MAGKYLLREDAPFDESVWSRLDEVVISAAKSQLSARKLLDIEGPYGLALKAVPLYDEIDVEGDVQLITSEVLPVSLIETTFTLGVRDIANFEQTGFSLDTGEIARAAMAVAAMEDNYIFNGNEKLGVEGLLNAAGSQSVKIGKWDEIGTAANDIINAINTLDNAGFHGPYLLALATDLYNKLYRLYPQGYQIELQHIESILGTSVIKAPGIGKGGVLIASGRQFASIIIGQDMMVGFVGPEDADFKLKISESLVPRIRVPASVCVLQV